MGVGDDWGRGVVNWDELVDLRILRSKSVGGGKLID